jgi:gamma-glutamyltranspeptidase/glutathione hydrolase
MKIAFAEAHAHVADPAHMRVRADQLLDDAFLSRRAAQIDLHRAATPTTQLTPDHGTVYLATADASGMMVSFIQSNYAGFGSGIVVPHTGIALQNRASGFRTDPTHPNGVAGHKRPYHTLIPGFATRNGQPELAFGVMGGHMQPQGHLQILLRLYTYHQDLQPALDAPRWYVHENFHLSLEAGTPPETVEALKQRGHVILNQTDYPLYGGGQLIRKLHGTYAAATDWRKDGAAVGY